MNNLKVLELLYIILSLPAFIITALYLYRNNRKLQEQRSQLDQVLDSIPLGIAKIDEEGKIIFESRKSKEILGCNFNDIQGYEHRELIHHVTEGDKTVNYIDGPPKKRSIVKQILNKDGMPLSLAIDIFKDGNGFLYVYEEAGEGQELENLQLQTQTIFNSIINVLFVTNKSGKIIVANKAFSRFLEMDLNEIAGMNIKELAQVFRFSPLEIFMKEIKYELEPLEVNITTIKGISKNILMYLSPIKSAEGDYIGFTGVGTDITLIKEEQYKLMQSEKLITLGQMAAGIVHEIRNPLTAIKGFSQIIQKLTKDLKVLECARLIDSETNNMNKVVTDFLKFARPSPPVLKEVKVRDLLESMKLIIESNAFIRKINLHFQYNKEDVAVFADDDQLRQVILNLAQNSMDAMTNTADPVLSIVSGYNKSTRQVYISVSDNGKGMTHDERIRAGTPFFTTKDRGTGLGLSVCMQIIREHGGHLKIDSTPGEGTTATVFLAPAVTKEKSSIA